MQYTGKQTALDKANKISTNLARSVVSFIKQIKKNS